MTREIKFRAWDNYSKSFVEDDEYLIGLNGKFYRMDFYSGIENYEDGNLIFNELDNITLSQFTGLLDKNGKEIFEGDIVEYNTKITSRRVVEWDDERVGFLLKVKGGYDGLMNYMEVTIIGNIYQNPELIGGENE